MNEPGPGAETLDVPTTEAAVLTVMRLFRALERVDTGLTPQQYRILKLAGAGGERSARLAERLAVAKPTLTATAVAAAAGGLLLAAPPSRNHCVGRVAAGHSGPGEHPADHGVDRGQRDP